MKRRNGWVSNSSSSSFIVALKYLSPWQIEQIENHAMSDEFRDDPSLNFNDAWTIYYDTFKGEECLTGMTIIDNFDMYDYMKNSLHIDMSKVEIND
jgi:hypothetical protein